MRSTTLLFISALVTTATAATYSYDCHNTYFPDEDQWKDPQTFETTARNDMLKAGDLSEEVDHLLTTVYATADQIGIDRRFAVAIMMRESTGNTNIVCGDNGVSCGVYQVKDGDHPPNTHVPSCYSRPCPKETTDKMIQCGLLGCGNGYSNVKDCWQKYAPNYAYTARCFNAGLYGLVTSDLAQGGGTPSYVQDIGNIMVGASSGSTSEQWGQMSCPVS